jgi:ABC-type uncharacterized transport system permease subunit
LAAFFVATYRAREAGTKRNLFDDVDLGIGVIAAGLAVAGMIAASEFLFYALAAVVGALWFMSVVRHAMHTYGQGDTYQHVSAH